MTRQSFSCFDGHTCGNPVRLVSGGAPFLDGATMLEKRQDFLDRFDWIRTGLMFEPRGHDMMSGALLYPPTRPDCDVGILYIETSGCLPMCGHGTIGTVTMALENGLVTPREAGVLMLDTPAGVVRATYEQEGSKVTSVRLINVASFLMHEGLDVPVAGLGTVKVDVAYGGNFYAIVDPQDAFHDMADYSGAELIAFSQSLRTNFNERYNLVHPEHPEITGLRHVQWTGRPTTPEAHARNAVFYGDKALDRSPCGTGTSARMAQWAAQGRLGLGDDFIHESIIGSQFKGRVEAATTVGPYQAIVPSIAGWAIQTGINTIFLDEKDPYVKGFSVL